MAYTLHVGDLVRATTNASLPEYKNGVVLEIQDQNIKIALPHPNRGMRYTTRWLGDAFVQPLTTQMVRDDVITSDEMKEALKFKNEMEQEVNSSNQFTVSRVKGGKKKTNKKRKYKSSSSKKRSHKKSKRNNRK